jgi:hypothetical protein
MRVALLGAIVAVLCASCGGSQNPATGAPVARQDRSRPIRTCPTSNLHNLVTENPRAATELVPPGATSALVCRYLEGSLIVEGKAEAHLDEHRVTDARKLRALRRAFDSLPLPEAGAETCTEPGFFLHYLVAFTYEREQPVYVHVGEVESSCAFAFNAYRNPYYEPTARLRRRLDSVLPKMRPVNRNG